MASLDEMNLILIQTPNVEKVQQAEQQNPDQTQRYAAVQEAEEHRKRTESIQTTNNTKEIKPVDNEKREKKNTPEQKQMKPAKEHDNAEDSAGKEKDDAGKIVDVLI